MNNQKYRAQLGVMPSSLITSPKLTTPAIPPIAQRDNLGSLYNQVITRLFKDCI